MDRRVYLDNLEVQLKALLKATDTAIGQRKMLAEASSDLAASLNTLSQVELSPSLSGPLYSLADVQLRIRDLYDRQAQQDVLTFGIVIDEYIRLIGSVKKAFEQRQRSWQGWHNAESDLQKRRSALDKLMRQGRSQQDKLSQLQADVGDAERRAHQSRLQFEDLGRGMRAELERFEREKVEDFRMGLETYLESAVEAQKEVRYPPFFNAGRLLTNYNSSLSSGRLISCTLTRMRKKSKSRLPRMLTCRHRVRAFNPQQHRRLMNCQWIHRKSVQYLVMKKQCLVMKDLNYNSDMAVSNDCGIRKPQ